MFKIYNNLESRLKRLYGKDPTNDSWHYMRENRLPYIQMFHDDSEESEVDDITWNDLDMDNVFFRINHTQSFLGEQILYHRLHNTNSKRDWDLFEKKVNFFDENEDLRIRLEKRLHGIGKAQESYYLTRLIKHTSDAGIKQTVILRLLQIILLVCLVGAIFFKQTICMIGLIIIVAVNITVYTYKKTKTEGMLTCFKNLSIIIKFCQFIRSQKDLPAFIYKGEINNDIDKLKKLAKMTGAFSSNRIMSNSDPQALFVDYLMGITLWDLTNYNHIIKVIKGNEDAVMRVLQYVGEIDMDISIASFRRSVDKYCLPDFKNNDVFKIKGLYNPLINDSVDNDIVMGKYTIITGANASGKSTFMKALGVNSILAQTIHTCCADEFIMPDIKIMTSMALRDDIISGDSYYVTEVKYLKRMLDCIEDGNMVLCIIDEILKGTNTVERVAASEAILRYLKNKNCFTVVATHDLKMVEHIREIYETYCFKSFFTESGVTFDYKIRKGICNETNAIELLSQYKFPAVILEDAKKICRGLYS